MSLNHLLVACTPPACVLLFPIARAVSCGVNRLRSVSMTTVHERLTQPPCMYRPQPTACGCGLLSAHVTMTMSMFSARQYSSTVVIEVFCMQGSVPSGGHFGCYFSCR